MTVASFYRLAAEEEKYNNKKSEAETQLAEYELYSEQFQMMLTKTLF